MYTTPPVQKPIIGVKLFYKLIGAELKVLIIGGVIFCINIIDFDLLFLTFISVDYFLIQSIRLLDNAVPPEKYSKASGCL